MWIMLACLSAVFAGVCAILAKCGIKSTDSTVATAIRTIVVLVFTVVMVLIDKSFTQLPDVSLKSWIFLVLSGIATGGSWLYYFKALQKGDINKVAAVDKSSTCLTIVLAFVLLGESVTPLKFGGVCIIAIGTYLMIERKVSQKPNEIKKGWLFYAVLSAVFASLCAILSKIGISFVSSNLGTAIRTFVVLIMAWGMVFITKKQSEVAKINKKELLFICLSGIATGGSWLCYYKALKDSVASVVVPIDKMSILVTVGFSFVVYKEKLSKKSAAGLALLTAGTVIMAL